MGCAPRTGSIAPPVHYFLMLVHGSLMLLVRVRVLAALELHNMEVDHVMLNEDVRPIDVMSCCLQLGACLLHTLSSFKGHRFSSSAHPH